MTRHYEARNNLGCRCSNLEVRMKNNCCQHGNKVGCIRLELKEQRVEPTSVQHTIPKCQTSLISVMIRTRFKQHGPLGVRDLGEVGSLGESGGVSGLTTSIVGDSNGIGPRSAFRSSDKSTIGWASQWR